MEDNLVEINQPVGEFGEQRLGASQMGQTLASISAATRKFTHAHTQGASNDIQSEKYCCDICGRLHAAKKSLRRHLRTVHQPKTHKCSQCQSSFTRNDVLVRHMAEQHSEDDARIECKACGRLVSQRALLQHLDSKFCKKARAVVRNSRFDGLGFGFPGRDDDAFLLTLRMFLRLDLRFSFCDGDRESRLTSALFSRDESGNVSVASTELAQWDGLYGRTLDLTVQQIERDIMALHIYAALWSSALLLGLMSFARGLNEDALAHFNGADNVLTIRHQSCCNCASYEYCKNWRRPTMHDPMLAVIGRLFDERGFTQAGAPLLNVSMTDNDAMRSLCLQQFKMLHAFSSRSCT